MSTPNVQSLIDLLWPEGDGIGTNPVFALLDGARDRRIEPMLRLSQRQYASLYSGRMRPALAAAAPYVVYLARESRFTRELLESAWGNHWGVMLAAPPDCTHEQIRRHFRRFLQVKDEDGRTLIFRLYDPRVLPLYVRSCTSTEAEDFFGPVVRFVTEGAHADAPPIVLENPRKPTVSILKGSSPRALPLMRREQMFAMARPLWERLQRTLFENVQRKFAARARELGEPGFKLLFDKGLEKADKYRLQSDAERVLAVELCIQYGPDFDRGPTVNGLATYLADAKIPGGQRLRTLRDQLQAAANSPSHSR